MMGLSAGRLSGSRFKAAIWPFGGRRTNACRIISGRLMCVPRSSRVRIGAANCFQTIAPFTRCVGRLAPVPLLGRWRPAARVPAGRNRPPVGTLWVQLSLPTLLPAKPSTSGTLAVHFPYAKRSPIAEAALGWTVANAGNAIALDQDRLGLCGVIVSSASLTRVAADQAFRAS
jgi:hypothetical protein